MDLFSNEHLRQQFLLRHRPQWSTNFDVFADASCECTFMVIFLEGKHVENGRQSKLLA